MTVSGRKLWLSLTTVCGTPRYTTLVSQTDKLLAGLVHAGLEVYQITPNVSALQEYADLYFGGKQSHPPKTWHCIGKPPEAVLRPSGYTNDVKLLQNKD